MKNYLSNLASLLQGIAVVISDGERVQKECPPHLKSALLEASHALDGQSVSKLPCTRQAGNSKCSRGASSANDTGAAGNSYPWWQNGD
jgi:hypothetical protein